MPATHPTYALSEATSDDLHDYDVISNGPRSLDSSITDLEQASISLTPREPAAAPAAKEMFDTVALTADDIQAYVRKAVNGSSKRSRTSDTPERTVRVYVDGVFDVFHSGNAHQLRQAKLSFPAVQLIVGAFPDDQCRLHGVPTAVPCVERCELLRHCRWVDEVVPDAPFVLDEGFLLQHRIDYVAIEEGSSIDPTVDKARLAGYDIIKSSGKVIPTRKTKGLVAPTVGFRLEHASEIKQIARSESTNTDTPEPADVFGLGI